MSKLVYIHIVLVAALLGAQGSYSVDEVEISAERDSTFILIRTSGPADFKKFTIDNPPRFGIDFFGAIFNLPNKEYTLDKPGIVMSVRGSQNKPAPNPVARIVFDLVDKAQTINERKHPEGVLVAIYTPGYPKFEKWSTGKGKPLIKPAVKESVAVAESAAVAKPETAAVAKPESAAVSILPKEIPPELAMYMRPETLYYKGITADKETIEVAKYIRNMVLYTPKGGDPFVKPKRSKELPLGKQPLPQVENLSVVGIVKAGDLRVALLQDKTGFGYTIAPGDSVEGGICKEITDTSALFNLFEFGQVRMIELPLVKPKKTK